MPFADTEQGLYDPTPTPLHGLDPRLKLLACLLLVILGFTSANAWQLALPAAALGCAVCLCTPALQRAWRLCLRLRWLLLVTLLMHLFFSPGRTLFGLEWLSRDGLGSGLLVCAQICLALVASSLLTGTTSAAELSRALGWVLSPLQRLGIKVDAWQQLLQLSLQLLPEVQGRVREARAASRFRLRPFLFRLIDRGDALARAMVAGDFAVATGPLPPLLPLARGDLALTLSLIALLGGAWLSG